MDHFYSAFIPLLWVILAWPARLAKLGQGERKPDGLIASLADYFTLTFYRLPWPPNYLRILLLIADGLDRSVVMSVLGFSLTL